MQLDKRNTLIFMIIFLRSAKTQDTHEAAFDAYDTVQRGVRGGRSGPVWGPKEGLSWSGESGEGRDDEESGLDDWEISGGCLVSDKEKKGPSFINQETRVNESAITGTPGIVNNTNGNEASMGHEMIQENKAGENYPDDYYYDNVQKGRKFLSNARVACTTAQRSRRERYVLEVSSTSVPDFEEEEWSGKKPKKKGNLYGREEKNILSPFSSGIIDEFEKTGEGRRKLEEVTNEPFRSDKAFINYDEESSERALTNEDLDSLNVLKGLLSSIEMNSVIADEKMPTLEEIRSDVVGESTRKEEVERECGKDDFRTERDDENSLFLAERKKTNWMNDKKEESGEDESFSDLLLKANSTLSRAKKKELRKIIKNALEDEDTDWKGKGILMPNRQIDSSTDETTWNKDVRVWRGKERGKKKGWWKRRGFKNGNDVLSVHLKGLRNTSGIKKEIQKIVSRVFSNTHEKDDSLLKMCGTLRRRCYEGPDEEKQENVIGSREKHQRRFQSDDEGLAGIVNHVKLNDEGVTFNLSCNLSATPGMNDNDS